jgi:hypothetical protein
VLAAVSISAAGAVAPTSGLPQPAAYDRLSDVSCVSAADCWAVGSAQDMNNKVTGEILHWTGSSWKLVSSSAAAGALSRISCTSVSSCVAIGSIGNGAKRPIALVIRWNGMAWTRMSLPNPSKEILNDVTCTSRSNCWIVGESGRTGAAMLALHWTGARWSETKTLPADKYGEDLERITCTTASRCWALGSYYGAPLKPTVSNYQVALRWNGASWRKTWTSKPYPGGDSSQSVGIAGVTCPAASNCLAVGAWGLPGVYSTALEDHWNGRGWSTTTPPRLRNIWLYGLACTSSRRCWAVGSIGGLSGAKRLILADNGTSWTRVKTPAGETLYGVSCTSSSNCWAVGDARSTSGSANIIQHWDGHRWSST